MDYRKNAWATPSLEIYGDVSIITRQSGIQFTDVPQGSNGDGTDGVTSGPCPPGRILPATPLPGCYCQGTIVAVDCLTGQRVG